MAAALAYLEEQDFEDLMQYETQLSAYAGERLKQVEQIHILGPDIISPVLTFEAERLGAYDIGVLLASHGIAIRCGAHCAYPLIKRMKRESICRISLAFYNTKEEIDYVADTLEHICKRRI